MALPVALGCVIAVIAAVAIAAVAFLAFKRVTVQVKDGSWMEEASEVCSAYPGLVASQQWLPLQVAAVASVFRIAPGEVDFEYKKEADAKAWIIRNTFPDNELTDKLATSKCRFLESGYDYKPFVESKPSIGSAAPPPAPSKSAANLEKGTSQKGKSAKSKK